MKKAVAVIGGGPAGLMAAEVMTQAGVRVDVHESMPSPGRKFLLAGKSGLNLTHAEPFDKFITRYGNRKSEILPFLRDFTPDDLRGWAGGLGVETFIGTSGRVFPVGMKSSPLLRAWLQRLLKGGVNIHTHHTWKGWKDGRLILETPDGELTIEPDALILALGGASWPALGSKGDWVGYLEQAGVKIEPFRPSNCGFDVNWSSHFKEKFHGHPIKSVVLSFEDFKQQGEFIVTMSGVEGSLIYMISSRLRDSIERNGKATIVLDLAPGSAREKIIAALARSRGPRTMSSHMEKTIGLKGVKAGLLYEFVPREEFGNPVKLAGAIKELHIPLIASRPIEEAISSAGGVKFDELDQSLMLKKIPGVFCAGEMLDWEAPTGGYLLTACFATGRAAGLGVLKWLGSKN